MSEFSSVGVIGVHMRLPVRTADQSLEELQHDVARKALADAGMDFADVDGIVVAGNDQFDGRAISVMAASGPVGGVNRDILSTPSASEHAFVMGALRVRSGLYRNQLVVAWSPLEVGSLPEAERLGADPYYSRALPLDELSAAALQASRLCAEVEGMDEAARRANARNRANGRRAYPTAFDSIAGRTGPARWPIAADLVGAPVAGAVALVLAAPEFIDGRTDIRPAWLAGMGWATEPSHLGDRDLARSEATQAAARRAYGEAGIADPRGDVRLAEVGGATPYQELLALEGLGISGRQDWLGDMCSPRFTFEGDLPVNPSGGAQYLNPSFCSGLMRIGEAANQVRGCAGRHQLAGGGPALAHAASGFAMAYSTVAIFANEDGRH